MQQWLVRAVITVVIFLSAIGHEEQQCLKTNFGKPHKGDIHFSFVWFSRSIFGLPKKKNQNNNKRKIKR